MEIKSLNQLENYFQKGNLFGLPGVNRIEVARNEKCRDIDLLIEDDVSLEPLISFQKVLKQDTDVPVDFVLSKHAEPIILYRA